MERRKKSLGDFASIWFYLLGYSNTPVSTIQRRLHSSSRRWYTEIILAASGEYGVCVHRIEIEFSRYKDIVPTA